MKIQHQVVATFISLIHSTIGFAQDSLAIEALPIVDSTVLEVVLDVPPLNYNVEDGTVEIFQDNRITAITNEISGDPFIYGFALQVEVSQQKSVIKNARYRIIKFDADIPIEEAYKAPNIYLYAGRFYDRLSAYAFKNKLSGSFPNSIVIGPKRMKLPPQGQGGTGFMTLPETPDQ